ncbi:MULTISPECIES: biotin synthase BioB [unclassified Actinopolyspora]|uniref:biotin synthase BioB n=1 Tax=Actinopolyspora TaxID=1849 RepID=UPI0013F5E09C|nr:MULTISPECIES: biotin synthase BioB [unclassified Actinopolyspora]NHD17053.1 biotin synthase BioB [Actinopolyspora sp. BKK2]NHE76205.1 biotin synthase BioB [Actinopolyspora sp. BKK1]
MTNPLDELVTKALQRRAPTREEAAGVLTEEFDVLDVVAAAARVRRHFFGNRVKLNTIINMKSGLCPEDCTYCAQRLGSDSEILKYSWVAAEEAAEAAEAAAEAGAKRICLVASGRGPGQRDVNRVGSTIEAILRKQPDVEICACLGLLSAGQAEQLRAAGAYAYSHNLNTNEERYSEICSTHTFADRTSTVREATSAGLSPCSGAIFGTGESDSDVISLALELRELSPDSVPVNFLIPMEGTPLEGQWHLTPQRCLRILALYRFFFPDVELRLAGGREIHLRNVQALALHVANSMFLGDYLTSEGQTGDQDRRLITDAGFVIEGKEEATLPEQRQDLVHIRRRGVGTDVAPNV